jgi:hypothetical protein
MYNKMLSERRKHHESRIRDEAKRIRELIEDGYLFGEKLDMDNINHLIAGAFYCGRMHGQREYRDYIGHKIDSVVQDNSALK